MSIKQCGHVCLLTFNIIFRLNRITVTSLFTFNFPYLQPYIIIERMDCLLWYTNNAEEWQFGYNVYFIQFRESVWEQNQTQSKTNLTVLWFLEEKVAHFYHSSTTRECFLVHTLIKNQETSQKRTRWDKCFFC